jgi:Meiotically up-regulated gene 113
MPPRLEVGTVVGFELLSVLPRSASAAVRALVTSRDRTYFVAMLAADLAIERVVATPGHEASLDRALSLREKLRGEGGGGRGPVVIPSQGRERFLHSNLSSESATREETMAFVYVIRSGDGNVFKIGKARDVESRRGQFMTGNPDPLTVIDTIETDDAGPGETFLHSIYQSKRMRGEFFALTPTEAEEAGRKLRDYLADYLPLKKEAERLAKTECDGPARLPDDRERATHQALLKAREEKYRLEVECERLENELKVAIGTTAGLDGIATWKTHTVTRFDEASFRREQPELHAAFSRPLRQRTFRLLWSQRES